VAFQEPTTFSQKAEQGTQRKKRSLGKEALLSRFVVLILQGVQKDFLQRARLCKGKKNKRTDSDNEVMINRDRLQGENVGVLERGGTIVAYQ